MKKFVLFLVLVSLTTAAALPASAQHLCRNSYGQAIACPTAVSQFSNPSTIASFDPQPEPPGTIRGFNPQPDPPRWMNNQPGTGYDAVGFNPQPDPPREELTGR